MRGSSCYTNMWPFVATELSSDMACWQNHQSERSSNVHCVCVGGANRFVHDGHLMATSVTDETVRRDAPGSTEPSTITQPIATTQLNAITQLNTTIQPSVTTLQC